MMKLKEIDGESPKLCKWNINLDVKINDATIVTSNRVASGILSQKINE